MIWGQNAGKLAVRTGQWKLIGDALYNLGEDPRETTDLAARFPERAGEMAATGRAILEDAIRMSPHD